MLQVTHVREDGKAVIINNGSCISTVVYSDYSGLTMLLDVTKSEFKRFLKKHHYREAVLI